jgi:hypothetical protein
MRLVDWEWSTHGVPMLLTDRDVGTGFLELLVEGGVYVSEYCHIASLLWRRVCPEYIWYYGVEPQVASGRESTAAVCGGVCMVAT